MYCTPVWSPMVNFLPKFWQLSKLFSKCFQDSKKFNLNSSTLPNFQPPLQTLSVRHPFDFGLNCKLMVMATSTIQMLNVVVSASHRRRNHLSRSGDMAATMERLCNYSDTGVSGVLICCLPKMPGNNRQRNLQRSPVYQ